MPTQQSNSLLDIKEVAATIGCSTRTIGRMVAAGRMPEPLKLGALVRWDSKTLESWIAKGCPASQRRQKRGVK